MMKKHPFLLVLLIGYLAALPFVAQALWTQHVPATPTVSPAPSTAVTAKTTAAAATAPAATTQTAAPVPHREESLFIGDSRTMGLSEYGGITHAHFFAYSGMSVYTVWKERVVVPAVGKLTLTELLHNHSYRRIYVMLGINELGYTFDSTVATYGKLLEELRRLQPDAAVYVMANLHVTAERSKKDAVFNNAHINRFNAAISRFADGKTVYYLDVNTLFDDKSGALNTAFSADSTHVLGKYYREWAQWLQAHTPK